MPGLVYSPSSSILPGPIRGSNYDNLMHIADVLPTILGGLLGDSAAVEASAFDGVDHWTALLSSTAHPAVVPAPRGSLLLNIDYLDSSLEQGDDILGYDVAALIDGDYKLIVNSGALYWYEVPTEAEVTVSTFTSEAVIPHTFLFHITEDPNETTDVSGDYPEIVEKLLSKLADERKDMVPCEWRGDDPAARRALADFGFVGPWLGNVTSAPMRASNCRDGFNVSSPGKPVSAEVESRIAAATTAAARAAMAPELKMPNKAASEGQ